MPNAELFHLYVFSMCLFNKIKNKLILNLETGIAQGKNITTMQLYQYYNRFVCQHLIFVNYILN